MRTLKYNVIQNTMAIVVVVVVVVDGVEMES